MICSPDIGKFKESIQVEKYREDNHQDHPSPAPPHVVLDKDKEKNALFPTFKTELTNKTCSWHILTVARFSLRYPETLAGSAHAEIALQGDGHQSQGDTRESNLEDH